MTTGLSAQHQLELVAALRLWKGSTATVVKSGIAMSEDVKAIRLASASTDGLFSRLSETIKQMEKAK